MCLCVTAASLINWEKSYVMKGPNDDQLVWLLKGHCEVKLLNQISNSENQSLRHHWKILGVCMVGKWLVGRPVNITSDIVIGSLVVIIYTMI